MNNPYYCKQGYEAIDIIEAYGLNFSLGNTLKYLLRAGVKTDDPLPDLRKALDYLQHEIHRIESAQADDKNS